jgi:hypothetical protein
MNDAALRTTARKLDLADDTRQTFRCKGGPRAPGAAGPDAGARLQHPICAAAVDDLVIARDAGAGPAGAGASAPGGT